jgi:hypothetical protein
VRIFDGWIFWINSDAHLEQSKMSLIPEIGQLADLIERNIGTMEVPNGPNAKSPPVVPFPIGNSPPEEKPFPVPRTDSTGRKDF